MKVFKKLTVRKRQVFAALFGGFLLCIFYAVAADKYDIEFGLESKVNVYPTKVSTSEWQGVNSVLVQDLDDLALYQEFKEDNSAYLLTPEEIVERAERENKNKALNSTSASTTSSAVKSSSTDSVLEDISESEEIESLEDETIESSENEDVVSDSEQSVSFSLPNLGIASLFKTVSRTYVFTQMNTTTPLVTDIEIEEVVEETNTLSEVTTTAELFEIDIQDTDDISTSTIQEEIEVFDLEISSTTESAAVPEVFTESVTDIASTTNSTESISTTSLPEIILEKDLPAHSITFSGFEVPSFDSGQFVTGLQLRISLAARLNDGVSTTSLPYVDILFGEKGNYQNVGTILLDEEVSNAINGGYYLFSLPQYFDVKALQDSSVIIQYRGEIEDLDDIYLDAVWIELDTKTVTLEDLRNRGLAKKLTHLEQPSIAEMVSEQNNFSRTEAPVFNLKYESQRNFIISNVRSLLGRDLVKIKKASIEHDSFGKSTVSPEVTTTSDGLVTVQIPDEQLVDLQPGQYTIEVVYEEGGKEFTDSFSFQWGILTINPNKTEYDAGETADISMGALTTTGHTVCDATLDLYVVSPQEFITRVPVEQSGKCNGNNVVDVPDYSAVIENVTTAGEWLLYLERLDENGKLLSFTNDTFFVNPTQQISIERVGPTRIYPPATYPMELTVASRKAFDGILTERVPAEFEVFDTDAEITQDGDWQILSWDLTMMADRSRTVSYMFDAPDISPYLFNLGPAELVENDRADSFAPALNSSSTASSTIADDNSDRGNLNFIEHRQWQIASDAVGFMMLFWPGGAPPAGWSCVSCTGTDAYNQVFLMGSSTASSTGGTANHNHTVTTSVLQNTAATIESGSGGPAINTHDHTLTPTISSESNLPEYRQLQVIQYDTVGAPTTIPQNAIAIFDVASSSLPASWNRYAAQDGKYIYGENTVGTTGGSNTHSHTVSGTTGGSTGGTARTRGGGSQTTAATNGHTHTINTSTGLVSNEPGYITVVLGQASADVAMTNGVIAMWNNTIDSGWINLSEDGDPFSNRFIKPSTTYGVTSDVNTHSHANITAAQTDAPNAVTTGRSGGTQTGSAPNHQHNVNFTSFSTEDHLPPYITVIFAKRQGTDPVYEQVSSLWYVNNGAKLPTDEWPDDAEQAVDLTEREPITATSTPVRDGDQVRLRINVGVSNATSTAGSTFKLQYAAADVCSSATGWETVGDTSSSTVWRGYNNGSVSDHATLSTLVLASSTVLETYEENGYATNTPNEIPAGEYGEWDFVIEHNGAEDGTNYCFRMVEYDGTAFSTYTHYPQLYTNESPVAPTLNKLFDNEKTASTTPWFYFVSTDAEGETIHYQIQVDNDYNFSSPVIDKDTIDDEFDQFQNQVLTSDKPSYRQGEEIRFIPLTALTNGNTYYWRVRGQDPDGSNDWGDWSTIRSFTIDTSLLASAWFQTEDEQFDTNTLVGVESGSDELSLITGSTTGTTTSSAIDFDDGDRGTAWGSFSFNDTETSSDIKYHIQYLNESSSWVKIPDGDLTGNSSGFDADTPVILLGLDTDIYNTIRIVAVFNNAGSSPSLQDWTVNWGYRVETPTITKLFPSEQVGTTTPTFEFSTTDPQNDDLVYQVQWSTDETFVSSTTRTSDTDGGFINIDDGFNFNPFTSGETIQFTIQPADALTGTTTYWWRVRAKDPVPGADAYSFWTTARSFTVIPGTEVSTWFQTTKEQFDNNILSGTIALNNDSVGVATTATEAMIVYGKGNNTTPYYKLWNGNALGTETAMLDIGSPVRWAVVEAGTTREEYVAVTVGTDNDINAQVYNTGVWGDLQEMTISMGNTSARGFDVTYETLSGDAMVAYCDSTTGEADYYIWNGSTWTAGLGITLASGNNCEWLQLASDPVSDEIIVLMGDSAGSQYEAQVWNGTTWTNSTTQGGITEDAHEGMAVEYEESGGQAIIVTSDGNPARFEWNSWNGTTWGTAATQGVGDDFEWGHLARDEGSDEMILCYQDEDSDIGMVRWTGSAWVTFVEVDTAANSKSEPAFSCVFEAGGSRDNYILTTYANTTQTEYEYWDNSDWNNAGTQVNSITSTANMQLIRTGEPLILGTFFDYGSDALRFSTWDGTSWSATEDLTDDASVGTAPYGKPYYMAPRNPGTEGTVIVSPSIDFDDGNGPYWDNFSWYATTTGSSEIIYQIQYQTPGGSWAFIPNSDLPYNETGTTTGPVDLSGLNTNTYNVLRPYASLSCDGSNNCPTLNEWKIEWAGGIRVSGTIQDYDQSTDINSGTVAVAVNGVEQTGKTGSVINGTWSISNVTTFPGDVVTVWFDATSTPNQAVGVTRYDGQGDIGGMELFRRHISLGSNDATSTALTNADIGGYDYTNNPTDIFFDLSGTTLTACVVGGCGDVEIYINASTTYNPTGRLVTHDIQIDGTFVAGNYTHELNGSWDNNGTSTMTGSTVVFAATSTTETIDSTGAVLSSFNNVTFGTTTGSGVWTLASTLDVNGDLTVTRGTLSRGGTAITLAGDLLNEANGNWSGVGTTTFDGGTSATWADQNSTLQNVGNVVIDGSAKIVSLAGNVAAEKVVIGANDTLDVTVAGHDITVYDQWLNQNIFLPRTGEVFFAATSTGSQITTNGDAFYDLTFNGIGGGWAFTESTTLVNNDFTISTGTVSMPTATTTIAGSFDATGGAFSPNNGILYFTSSGAETITFDGTPFTNVAYNLTFNGGGSWTITDTNATATNDIRVSQGSVIFPSGVLAIGGTLTDDGGSFSGNGGVVRFYSSFAEVITAGGSSFTSTIFDGTGSWSFADTNVTMTGSLNVVSGAVTLPSGTLSIGGSYDNASTVDPNGGTVRFNSNDTGETIDFGSSSLYNVVFNGSLGGFTITSPATTTNDFTLTNASDWTLSSGQYLSVGGTFTNSVGGASTTWTGTTLSLEAGSYSVNSSADTGDNYETLRVKANTDIAIWNSVATTTVVDATGSLYSQDHNAFDGDLYIFGNYVRNSGTEYWSNYTDFDGTDLTGSERQANVRFASGASADITDSIFVVTGSPTASTTIANQGAGTYNVSVTGGTTTAQYYEFADLGSTGLSLLGGNIVTTLRDGSYTVAAAAGSALTLSSTTIDANPAKQIYDITFATSTAISATNVTQTDGTPISFWWFREGQGNLYGENYDNDTGNPGSVRFDDSALQLTISGVVYEDDTTTPMGTPTCDDSTPVVRIMVNRVLSTTVSCSSADGSYIASPVTVVGDPTITIFLKDSIGGEYGSLITRTPTANITNADIYENRIIVRNEDSSPLTIANLAVYDADDDPDLRFTAATTTDPDFVTVFAGNELFVFASSTFAPGGDITLNANASGNSYDGTLYIDGDATLTGASTSVYTIGGRMELETGAIFTAASTSVIMNATTTGKSITSPSEITFHDLTFNGIGGGWNLGADIRALGDIDVTTGTVTGTGDITLPNGSLSGNGVLSMGGGTTTVESSNTLGGTSEWTFYDLTLGSGLVVGTTTPAFTGTTTVSGRLTISNAHFLDSGNTKWDLAGTDTVFVETGTFLEDTSTIRYSGAGSNVISTNYYNLDINAGVGSPTYTATGLGIIVTNNLTVGGEAASTFDLNSSDPAFDVNGDIVIKSNGTMLASNSGSFTAAGNFLNDGTFTANSGSLTLDGAGTISIEAGNSSFATLIINGTGNFTVAEHATATTAWTLTNHNAFTVSSGQVLAVGGTFSNGLGDTDTTWTGSTLRLYGGGDYEINTKTVTDTYDTLTVAANTQIRMWGSEASTYDINSTGSLYSMDHADNNGDLYIWGAYTKSSANDYWNYARDFDGTALGGSPRQVGVYMATSSRVLITGGDIAVVGAVGATTTIQSQTSETYSLRIGGNASTTMRYYATRDIDSSGLVLSGTPKVVTLSNGDLEVSQNGGTAMTVGGTVISQNPAKNFGNNRFALNGVGSGFNVTATGTSVSSWRFTNHIGDIDGESFDVDPDGDPGYVSWDDSAALITVSGNVYEDDTTTNYAQCDDGATENIALYVDGTLFDTTGCNSTTGAYSFSNVAYGVNDTLTVYITGETENGVTVTQDPVSNINSLDIYVNHVIVRHENTSPMTIADMEVWDSDDDANIIFDAEDLATDTLTMPADTKLVIWTGKEFAPGGDVTIANGGTEAYGGSLELQDSSNWIGAGTEDLSVGGSMTLGTSAVFDASNGTTTFSTNGAGRTIDVNEDSFYNVAFTGSGSWSVTDATMTADGYILMTGGTVTLSSGTTTVASSFINNGGAFDANGGLLILSGTGAHTLAGGGSDFADIQVIGSGSYNMTDTNATATDSFIIADGTVTLPSGILAVGGDFRNTGGTITHNTSEISLTNVTAGLLLASSSDLYAVTINGAGAFTMEDGDIALLDSLSINAGSLTLASGTLSIGGSFIATGGTFSYLNPNATNTILFNSTDTGEIINPGNSDFYNVQIGAPTGGYTMTGNATTTNNFSLVSASSFTAQSGVRIYVGNVFNNAVGGSATDWDGSTLVLDGSNAYSINTKSIGGDQYQTLVIGAGSDIRSWNSAATTTTVDSSSSLYSQDHGAIDGDLNIYGDFHIGTTTEYWSYATDFDGTSLSGSERVVTVSHAANATTTVDGGTLNIVGASGNETTITNQGSGTYAMNVSDGTFNAQYYTYRNLNATGLNLTDTPAITSLSYGDFELAVDTGSLISLSSSTLNANASLVIIGNRFATTTAISGNNVNLSGTTASAWTFVSHTGNLDGEDYDVDGATACGQIRWDNSACLLTQQTHYRWRNDNGGLGVPNSEWFDPDWDARKRVRIENTDATTYTDAVVQLFVTYDSDMQSDFDDIRFTDSSGTTSIPHWFGSTTDSVVAEVWVKVPSLPASDTATVFMYYNNPTALSSSSASSTFIVADDFEDGNINEYNGETSEFTVDGTFAYDGNYALDATGNESGQTDSGGIYDINQNIQQGQTIRYMQYVVGGASNNDEVCTMFGIQTIGVPASNYAVCTDLVGTERVVLVRDVVDNADSGTVLASKNVTFTTGWYEVEIDWGTDDSILVSMYDDTGALFATTSATDSNYDEGGLGFTYWFQNGGWDSFSSRPTLTTEPTIRFGVEQTDGGATWAADLDTAANDFSVGDIARLRILVENTGLGITGQNFQLEYAEQGAAPSCEAVTPASYTAVPVQSSCAGSPVCMQGSGNITNGAITVDLLSEASGDFTPGEAREDPSNTTGNLNVGQDEYIELEYVVTPTVSVSDQNLCFRVTDNGADYDTYLRVAKMSVRFDPSFGTVFLNGSQPISLSPGATTTIYATGTVSDLNGYTDLSTATATIYRSGVAGGASCTADNNNCYISAGAGQCDFIDCAGNSCTVQCAADIYFYADPTDVAPYEGEEWTAFLEVEDSSGGYDFGSAMSGVELYTLRAININDAIDYGAVAVTSDTGSDNASTTIYNEGNIAIDIEVQATDLLDGYTSSKIPGEKQKFATSTFTYSACVSCVNVSTTTSVGIEVDLAKPTTETPPVEDKVFWGISVPYGVNSAPHTGINIFTPVDD